MGNIKVQDLFDCPSPQRKERVRYCERTSVMDETGRNSVQKIVRNCTKECDVVMNSAGLRLAWRVGGGQPAG